MFLSYKALLCNCVTLALLLVHAYGGEPHDVAGDLLIVNDQRQQVTQVRSRSLFIREVCFHPHDNRRVFLGFSCQFPPCLYDFRTGQIGTVFWEQGPAKAPNRDNPEH